MKLIIAGGRDYEFSLQDYHNLDKLHRRTPVTEVVTGGCRGADSHGEHWAASHQIPKTRFEANWHLFGRSAGPMRNKEMAEYADAVALFPGRAGTENMRQNAMRAGLKIYDFTNKCKEEQ